MRKFLLVLFGITTMFGLNKVYAADIKFEYDTNINEVESAITEIGADKVSAKLQELIDYYKSNYSYEYPYFHIGFKPGPSELDYLIITLDFYTSQPTADIFLTTNAFSFSITSANHNQIYSVYDFTNNSFIDFSESTSVYPSIIFSVDTEVNYYNPYSYYYSNFNFYYDGAIFKDYDEESTLIKADDNLLIPTFEDSSLYSVHKADSDFLIEPYYLNDENEYIKDENYITIDLNQYSYVILSLKDYTPRDTFTTTMYVKGKLCATPVYNYGSEEKKDYISGYQTPSCGVYEEDYKSYLAFIREEDIKNHAVFYYTTSDFSKPNLVKVDSSIFNITYITSDNEDNPSITIDGKNYQTLPHSSLTDSAILTEKNGISTDWTCAKYDTDCFMDSSGIDIDNLFTNPLETLKTIWDSIVSIFEIITEFIELLPPIMQAFLYLAFGVGIALGIIKIIL